MTQPQKTPLLNTTALTPTTWPPVVVTCSKKGGVGKTFAAATAITSLQLAGIKPFRIVEYDPVCPLRAMYGEANVDSRAAGPEFQRRLIDPIAYTEHVGQLLDEIGEPTMPHIVDLGAEMAEQFLKIGQRINYGVNLPNRGRHIRIIITTTTDRTDFDGASATYHEARSVFPESPIAFVISERQGSASMLSGQKLISALNNDPLARIVIIPPCPPTLFATLYGNGRISPRELMRLDIKKLNTIRSVNLTTSSKIIYLQALHEWLAAIQAAYGDFLPLAAAKAA